MMDRDCASAMVARKQEFTPDQILLLRASMEIIPILTQWMSKLDLKINSGARMALSVQRLDKPTYEQGGRTKTQDIMPGWLPVINCKMVAAPEHTIGLECALPCPRAVPENPMPNCQPCGRTRCARNCDCIGQADHRTVLYV
jgi:hypothetical protein